MDLAHTMPPESRKWIPVLFIPARCAEAPSYATRYVGADAMYPRFTPALKDGALSLTTGRCRSLRRFRLGVPDRTHQRAPGRVRLAPGVSVPACQRFDDELLQLAGVGVDTFGPQFFSHRPELFAARGVLLTEPGVPNMGPVVAHATNVARMADLAYVEHAALEPVAVLTEPGAAAVPAGLVLVLGAGDLCLTLLPGRILGLPDGVSLAADERFFAAVLEERRGVTFNPGQAGQDQAAGPATEVRPFGPWAANLVSAVIK